MPLLKREMDMKQEEDTAAIREQPGQKTSFPGDVVFSLDTISTRTLFLGPGVRKEADNLIATRCGVLRYRPPATFFLDTSDDSYLPATGDDIVGVVVRRRGQEVLEQYYVVDFGKNTSRQTGVLPILAFKGATKRYRPNLKKGDLVYCRVRKTTVDGPVRLTCTSNNTKEQFWGPLRRTGALYRAKLSFVRRCLTEGSAEHSMIMEVGAKFPFESAVGLNGRIWLYTGFEKSQNLLYLLFRDAEEANGDIMLIKKITGRFLQETATLGDDFPVEDNTQYWVTRVA